MKREEFYKKVSNDYFGEAEMKFEDFKKLIKSVLPIFGELEVKVENKKDGKKLIFIDNDEADLVLSTSKTPIPKEALKMSHVALSLSLNENDIITIIENDMQMFTPANKELVLFLGFLIEKKIIF